MSIHSRFSDKELEILQARAQRIAGATQGDQEDDIVTALVVKARSETYALPLETITAVYDEIPVIPVPCVPPFVAGIANIRGHIIPVIDLAVLLDVPGEQTTDTTALVVTANDEMSIAFCVEAIGEVMPLLKESLSPLPETLAVTKTTYLQGTLADGTVLLDLDAILHDPALIVNESVA